MNLNLELKQVINESKLKRQQESILKWRNAGGIGTAHLTMRFGKTYEGILIIEKVLERSQNEKINIIVPSVAVVNNWLDNLEKNGLHNKSNIKVLTAHQVLNAPDEEHKCHLKIIDEVHKFLSDRRFEIISGVKAKSKFLLCLTGTLPAGNDLNNLIKYAPVFDTITEQEAIEKGWISDYTEYNLALEFPDEDKELYREYSYPIGETLGLFKGSHKLFEIGYKQYLFEDDYDVIQSCYSGKKYNKEYIKAHYIREELAKKMGWREGLDLTNEFDRERDKYWSPDNIGIRAKVFNENVRKRTSLINDNKIKLLVVMELYKKFPIQTICFNESIDFTDKVRNAINALNYNAVSYHSAVESGSIINPKTGKPYVYGASSARIGEPKMFGKKKILEDMLAGMKDGRYTFLSTARALDEGIDIPNVEQIITTAGTTNPLQYQQRTARGKTVDIYNPNKITRIINLYFDDFDDGNGNIIKSRDKQKLKSRQKLGSSNVYYVDDIDDIQ